MPWPALHNLPLTCTNWNVTFPPPLPARSPPCSAAHEHNSCSACVSLMLDIYTMRSMFLPVIAPSFQIHKLRLLLSISSDFIQFTCSISQGSEWRWGELSTLSCPVTRQSPCQIERQRERESILDNEHSPLLFLDSQNILWSPKGFYLHTAKYR